MSESKLFEDLFFCSCLDIFSEKGGLPYSKLLEELLSLSLDIFEEGGGSPCPYWGYQPL